MILITLETISGGIDLILMIALALLALFLLVAPYDTVKKVFPKAVSKKVIRICAAVVLCIMFICLGLLLFDII